MAHQVLPQAEGDGKQAAETDVDQQAHPVAGRHILITLFKNHIGHISGEHRVKGCGCQQGKDKDMVK